MSEEFKVVSELIEQNYTTYLGGNESVYYRQNVLLMGRTGCGIVSSLALNKASFCCAIAELGNFAFSRDEVQDSKLLTEAIQTAWKWNKGLITATLTNYSHPYYHDILKKHGFVETDTFRNPNTGKTIFRYNLYQSGVKTVE